MKKKTTNFKLITNIGWQTYFSEGFFMHKKKNTD